MGLEQKLPGFITSKLGPAVNWARKFSLFQYPFVTACCGMEYMATAASRYDIARFGAEIPRFSPRQADLLFVVGTVNHKLAPFLQTVYAQMTEPKWVISFGVCASTGGFYDNYATVQGIDKLIPVDVYIPGCPPRPEQVIDALVELQNKIQSESWDKYAYERRRTRALHEGLSGQDPLKPSVP
ncbi:MAG: NADH-quinone oxidoreductase subunit B [Myxococcales bacterium]|nr:NADH-quinone oxidoreductase subunit B [Myxococcales bacterium]